MRTIVATVAVVLMVAACGGSTEQAPSIKEGDQCFCGYTYCCISKTAILRCTKDATTSVPGTLERIECNAEAGGVEATACHCADAIFAEQQRCP